MWHEDVLFFEARDAATDELLGHFYLDLYSRPGKFGHACAAPLMKRTWLPGRQDHPVAVMLVNFAKPTADEPSLLYHSEVQTFFHEFGHLMHNIATEANYSSLSGTSVEIDFVEMPALMLENWVWEGEILERLSSHY